MTTEDLRRLGFKEPAQDRHHITYWTWWYESPQYDSLLRIEATNPERWTALVNFEFQDDTQTKCVVNLRPEDLSDQDIELLKAFASLDSHNPKVAAVLKTDDEDHEFYFSGGAQDVQKLVMNKLMGQQVTHVVHDESVGARIRGFLSEQL
jgi:hypothetical protein